MPGMSTEEKEWGTKFQFSLLASDDSLELFYRLCLAASMVLGCD